MHLATLLTFFLLEIYIIYCNTSDIGIYNNKTEDTTFLFKISISNPYNECSSEIENITNESITFNVIEEISSGLIQDTSLLYICCETSVSVPRNFEIYWLIVLWNDQIKGTIICYGIGKVFSVPDTVKESITDKERQDITEKTIEPKVVRDKRDMNMKEEDFVTIPWQSLWLFQPNEQDCKLQDVMLALRDVSSFLQIPKWLKLQPDEPIGPCPVRFRSHVDHQRLWPRNLVVTECLCEGSRCARRGLQVCITVYARKTIYRYFTGKKRIMLPVGCLCAVQRAVYAKPVVPKIIN